MGRYIKFTIHKEPWIEYKLQDNSVLKLRTILQRIVKKTLDEKIILDVDAQTIMVVEADESLTGPKNNKIYTRKELVDGIDKRNMRINTISQEFNEYNLDDGTKIKIFTQIIAIHRTKYKDRRGEPIYIIDSSNSISIVPNT